MKARHRPMNTDATGRWVARPAAPHLRTSARRRHHLTWLQALALVAVVNGMLVVTAAGLVMQTDPQRVPDLPTGIWWAVTTITTVGYGDVVPVSGPGRLVAGARPATRDHGAP
jgi:hypothetical protein